MTAPCKGCQNRTVEPNCHMGCEKYLAFRREIDKGYRERCIRAGLDSYTIRAMKRSREAGGMKRVQYRNRMN